MAWEILDSAIKSAKKHNEKFREMRRKEKEFMKEMDDMFKDEDDIKKEEEEKQAALDQAKWEAENKKEEELSKIRADIAFARAREQQAAIGQANINWQFQQAPINHGPRAQAEAKYRVDQPRQEQASVQKTLDALGLQREGLTQDQLKKAYRGFVKVHHPDVAADKAQGEALFKEVSSGYSVLEKDLKK